MVDSQNHTVHASTRCDQTVARLIVKAEYVRYLKLETPSTLQLDERAVASVMSATRV